MMMAARLPLVCFVLAPVMCTKSRDFGIWRKELAQRRQRKLSCASALAVAWLW